MRHILLALILLDVTALMNGATHADDRIGHLRTRLSGGDATRIVCFGDSITGVYYHSGGQRAWCDMLGLALEKAYPRANLEMFNAGISGHTTKEALSRIQRDVLDRNPHLVVVKFGMNDVARVPIDQFKNNLKTIAKRCLASGSAVVLCTPNSVFENKPRPNARLDEYSDVVRNIAKALNLPLVDLFRDWQKQRKKDEIEWSLLMSDAIHPNMNGHRRIAELVTHTISDKPLSDLSLNDVTPPQDALQHTFSRLAQGELVRVVAMNPADREVTAALRKLFPEARFEITTWPVGSMDVAKYAEWAKRIRGLKPHLVVVAVPIVARSKGIDGYIRNYEWVLNRSFSFAGRPWDVLPILSETKGGMSAENAEYGRITEQIVRGKDVQYFVHGRGQLLSKWIRDQKDAWEQRQ